MPVARAPRTDPQRNRLYRLELECLGARGYVTLTQSRIRQFARSICRQYGVPQVPVTFDDLGVWGGEWCPDKGITISRRKSNSRDLITIAHELAHHVHDHFEPADQLQAPHGPQFMACYMSILDTARIIPVRAMKVICDQYRVRYHDPGERNSLSALQRAVAQPAST